MDELKLEHLEKEYQEMVVAEKKRKGKGIVIKEQIDGAETSDDDPEEEIVRPALTTAPKPKESRVINRLYNIIRR